MKLFLSLLSIFFTSPLFSQQTFFTFQSSNHINIEGERKIIPITYKLVSLDVNQFKLFQMSIPSEESNLNSTIVLPTPDGQFITFDIHESKMMLEPLYSKYKEIRTYTAISKTNKFVTAKIDFTVWGFHAKVFDGDNTYFIDPYTDLTNQYYVVYYKRDYTKPLNERMQCEVAEELENTSIEDISNTSLNKTHGLEKREYRLALACTMEYAAAVGGTTPTKASVLSAMVTSMNRVNGVFEREFAIHENLIGNNDTLIYLPGGTDPYTNNSGSTMLGENQTNINAIIGSANYDHGHVFSTGGGGIASLGSYCSSTSKAQGVTGSSNPIGDPFDIDYVAHEMGHQLGGSHTFNSVTGSCSGNRSSTSAYEIGSGTTIMAYAGICGSDNIQPHSDDFYTVRSLNQISTFLTTGAGNTCATKTNLTNKIPTFNIPILNRDTIPYKTPFELMCKNASDTDAHAIMYCWEQYNRGGSGNAWNASTNRAPILRSFNPTLDSNRTFPQYNKLIINNISFLGEILPDTQRVLTFKCTIRDIKNGYGSFNYSDDSVNLVVVNTGSELFRVNSQNTTGISYAGNSMQQVTWNVATTNSSTVNTQTVDIYVSPDSAKTWYLRLANTPNDGSEMISIPNIASDAARIKVKSHTSVFFDLNDVWFKITKVAEPASVKDVNANNINIYPNPAKDVFTVEINKNISNILIYNQLGYVVRSIDAKHMNKKALSITDLAKGLYLIVVKDVDNNQYLGKLDLH